MKNLNTIMCVLAVILYFGLVTNEGFATNDAVKTELKEQVPVENVTPTPIPPPEPPVVLDNETIMKVKEFLAKKFNKSVDEIEIQGAKETEYMLIVYTNVDSVSVRNGTVYETGLRLEPKINETEALKILMDELLGRGIITNSTVFHSPPRVGLYYEFSQYDHNYHPTHYASRFYFLKSLDDEKAVYERWVVNIDATSGEITRLDKESEVSFYNIKTREDAVKLLKEKKGMDVNPSGISLAFLSGGRGFWTYDTAGLSYTIRDDGSISSEPYPELHFSEGGGQAGGVVGYGYMLYSNTKTVGGLVVLLGIAITGSYLLIRRRYRER